MAGYAFFLMVSVLVAFAAVLFTVLGTMGWVSYKICTWLKRKCGD